MILKGACTKYIVLYMAIFGPFPLPCVTLCNKIAKTPLLNDITLALSSWWPVSAERCVACILKVLICLHLSNIDAFYVQLPIIIKPYSRLSTVHGYWVATTSCTQKPPTQKTWPWPLPSDLESSTCKCKLFCFQLLQQIDSLQCANENENSCSVIGCTLVDLRCLYWYLLTRCMCLTDNLLIHFIFRSTFAPYWLTAGKLRQA